MPKNTTFLNQPKATEPAGPAEPATPATSAPNRRRHNIKGKTKFQVIRYMQENPAESVADVLEKFKDVLPNTPSSTIRNWRRMKPASVMQLKNTEKTRIMKPAGKFKTLEDIMEKKRKERVDNCRDRSVRWYQHTARRLVGDQTVLKKMKAGEKKNIEKFNVSRGWLRKVIKRKCLKMKKIHSTASLSKKEFLVKRKEYLKTERSYIQKVGLFEKTKTGTMRFDTSVMINADETPLYLGKYNKRVRQISADGEATLVKPPPVVSSKKYRDGTVVPFIGYDRPLFFCVIVFGSEGVRQREVAPLAASYPNLLVWCNSKAYMLSGSANFC